MNIDPIISFRNLEYNNWKFHAFFYYPKKRATDETHSYRTAILTHGYTASKADTIAWAQRLVDLGLCVASFDLPGHYLGASSDVEDFDDFKSHAHQCFEHVYQSLIKNDPQKLLKNDNSSIILAGHSLGAMLSIKAQENWSNPNAQTISICVGLGQHPKMDQHLFESRFYQKTLDFRRQLVSPALSPDNVFPWIKEEKENFSPFNKRIHFITGLDDVVVGKGGAKHMADRLNSIGNHVTLDEPSKLPHHRPSEAAPHLYHFLKEELK